MKRVSPNPLLISVSVLLGLITALAVYWGFAAVARPGQMNARLQAVDEIISRAEKAGNSATLNSYPPGAVCDRPAATAAIALRKDVAGKIAASGSTGTELAVTPGAASGAAPSLVPIEVAFKTKGSYDSAMKLAASLAASKPMLLVDTADLVPDGAAITFKFTGKAYCWTSARR